MIRIIEVRQERGHQVCLVLDGAEDVRIDRRVWEESSCGIGSSLSEEGLEALLARSRRTRAKEKALFLLSRRDYSKKELFDRLSRERGRRHPERDEAAAETVQRMEELGLVDDEAYAARLAGEYIRRLYPRRRAVQELCGRGIGRELAEAAVDGMGTADADLALALLRKKYYNKLRDADGRRRIAAALARQGFSYEDIRYAFAQAEADLPEED